MAPRSGPAGDVDLASVGAVLAEPARARVLVALIDGRSLPAGVLATEAGVSASTISGHLKKLLAAGFVTVVTHGRYRYYRLAGDHIAELVEAVGRFAAIEPVTSLKQGTRAHAVRRARRCYNHVAGRLGVDITAVFLERGYLTGDDLTVDLARMSNERPAGGVIDSAVFTLTDGGVDELSGLGVRLPTGRAVRCCVDWTEQRHHVAGGLGRSLLDRLLDLEWVAPGRVARALTINPTGRREFRRLWSIDTDAYDAEPPAGQHSGNDRPERSESP